MSCEWVSEWVSECCLTQRPVQLMITSQKKPNLSDKLFSDHPTGFEICLTTPYNSDDILKRH